MSTFNISTKVSKLDDTSATIPSNGQVDILTGVVGKRYKLYGMILSQDVGGSSNLLRFKTNGGLVMSSICELTTANSNDRVSVENVVVGAFSSKLVTFKVPIIINEGQALNIVNAGAGAQPRTFGFIGEIDENTI